MRKKIDLFSFVTKNQFNARLTLFEIAFMFTEPAIALTAGGINEDFCQRKMVQNLSLSGRTAR
jgi:hypothetical protein